MKKLLILLFVLQIFMNIANGGELKTKLQNLEKNIKALDKPLDVLIDESKKLEDGCFQMNNKGTEGIEMLFTYVDQKLKKNGQTWAAVADNPISSISDKNVVEFLKNIDFYKNRAIEISKAWPPKECNELNTKIGQLDQDVEEIQKIIKKKKENC